MNILAYSIYLLITYLITVRVGWLFYRNGRIFILHLMRGEAGITDAINRILLLGYYLLNLGYATLMISTWNTLHSWTELLLTITQMTGHITLLLAGMHYLNVMVIYLISKRHLQKHHI
ncbi:hypothetical protein [Chitinophaga vietnamensis]|uniref:hypothetical protein n=1 Tax=Chitinophaga vietnamensis TaxID=2593957 RepID=UPI0011774FD4|nr:hypothetical protein [Chitinophaga vietnamensis]